jgi:hypothetical protein
MKYRWDEFLEEGEILYNYMINNFEKMFDGDNIKYFSIINGIYRNIKDTDKMTEEYGNKIEKKLIPWIKQEFEEGRLFNKELWKPFRNQSNLVDMYYGYKILFQYEEYYFQLAIEDYCDFDENDKRIDDRACFLLALYGWKNNNSNMLQPYNDSIIPFDNTMPNEHWVLK